ncbi:MAG: class I SAM-dependent methyltransferase [Anaerolineales bacterium]|nr:class I SAM-dependent methyltransferase [Anaerolineales bacterium]
MSSSVTNDFYNDRPLEKPTDLTWGLLHASLPLLEAINGKKFLDIGCNDGEKTLPVSRCLSAGQVVGVDLAFSPLRKAKGREIQVVLFDLNQKAALPFQRETFSCIYVGEVIEHVFSPDMLLSEIYRILQPGGYAVITTPNLASWRNRLVLLLGWQPFSTEVSTRIRVGNPRVSAGVPAGHIRMFTARALMEFVNYYGLGVEKIVGWGPGKPHDLLTFIFSLVDGIARRFFPSLCDEILLKVRKIPTEFT